MGIVLFVIGFLMLLVPVRILCLRKDEDEDPERKSLKRYTFV